MSAAVIVGTSFVTHSAPALSLGGLPLIEDLVETPHGLAQLHHLGDDAGPIILFRHGRPHRYLPHQIPYRAHLAALAQLGVDRLLVTSSVGVLRSDLQLYQPLLLRDLLMPDNRLPDGTACSMFVAPQPGQGHLVIDGGLFDAGLMQQLRDQHRTT